MSVLNSASSWFGTDLCEMPSDMEVELEVAAEPLQCVRSDALDTGALYVHTILEHNTTLYLQALRVNLFNQIIQISNRKIF